MELSKIEEEKEAVVFRCPFCQEQFDTLANLERHKNRNHLGVTPKECGFCVQETNVFGSQEHHVLYTAEYKTRTK